MYARRDMWKLSVAFLTMPYVISEALKSDTLIIEKLIKKGSYTGAKRQPNINKRQSFKPQRGCVILLKMGKYYGKPQIILLIPIGNE